MPKLQLGFPLLVLTRQPGSSPASLRSHNDEHDPSSLILAVDLGNYKIVPHGGGARATGPILARFSIMPAAPRGGPAAELDRLGTSERQWR